MTDNVTTLTIIELLSEKLKTTAEAQTYQPKYWVVCFAEDMPRPLLQSFESTAELCAFVKPRVNKPGFMFVLHGQHCKLAVGALPVLYTPSDILLLFDVPEPTFLENGSTAIEVPLEVIPEAAILDPMAELEDSEDGAEIPSPIQSVTPPPAENTPGPSLFPDDEMS